MSPSTSIVRWESTADSSRCGIEIAGLVLGEVRLEVELDRILGGLTAVRPAFILAGFGPGRPREVAAAISRASDFFFNAHVCVAVDHETLLAMDPAILRNKNFGVVLDHVDASTPLSAVSAEPVEAVRFEESFVQCASTDLRLYCLLDAMLRLARDLGLATLAPTSHPGQRLRNASEFDYVSTPPADR